MGQASTASCERGKIGSITAYKVSVATVDRRLICSYPPKCSLLNASHGSFKGYQGNTEKDQSCAVGTKTLLSRTAPHIIIFAPTTFPCADSWFSTQHTFSDTARYSAGIEFNMSIARPNKRLKVSEVRDNPNARDQSDETDDSGSSESEEEEDDEGELATEALDSEIAATLNALKSKDPSIYDKARVFYKPLDEQDNVNSATTKAEKPMHLQDYHRRNLLTEDQSDEDESGGPPQVPTYDEEQAALRKSVAAEMHAAADSDDEGGILIKKSSIVPDTATTKATKNRRNILDVENADRDPETFLSNFMNARAWVPEADSRFAHLDSDDSDEENRAESFENAYNMRFEDPKNANEKLISYARDVSKYSARRDEATGRKRAREKESEAKDQAKLARKQERARLRRLKIEEIENKVKLIREAAALDPSESVDLDDWKDMLEADFDDAAWEQQMTKRFGDAYYADEADKSGDEDVPTTGKRAKPEKKPKWDDDVDIDDIASQSGSDGSQDHDQNTNDEATAKIIEAKPINKESTAQDRKRVKRQQKAAIEALVDEQMLTADPTPTENQGTVSSKDAPVAAFRYRETSPSAFGLTARDILFADDKQLNEFAGIKKHHAFRDADKKRRDKKQLGKKARLRQWRKDTFGNDEGYQGQFADYIREKTGQEDDGGVSVKHEHKRRKVDNPSGKASTEAPNAGTADAAASSKKKRKRKNKGSAAIPQ